jgi:hypothetical protein
MVVSTYSPLSYVKHDTLRQLIGMNFAAAVDATRFRLGDLSIQRQRVPAIEVRTRRVLVSDVHGALGLDFLNRFVDITFNVPTLRLTLSR